MAPGSIEAEGEAALLDNLTDDAHGGRPDPDHSGYIASPALGLVIAVEGKNRVALQSRRVEWMPAHVDLGKGLPSPPARTEYLIRHSINPP